MSRLYLPLMRFDLLRRVGVLTFRNNALMKRGLNVIYESVRLRLLPGLRLTWGRGGSGCAGGVVTGMVTGCCAGVVSASSANPLLSQADELYDQMKYQEIYDLLYKHRNSADDEILWRLGRATFEKAKVAETDQEKKMLYREALDYVEEALGLNPNNFAVHKWMSILLDYVYGYEGTKARIAKSYVIKEHMLKACELNPTDGTSRYLLGYWYFSFASIPWYQKKIATVIFATPPSGTYEEALEQFLLAEKVEPNFYSKNLLMIGKCYWELGQEEYAREYLQRCKNYSVKTQEDEEAVMEAATLLKKL